MQVNGLDALKLMMEVEEPSRKRCILISSLIGACSATIVGGFWVARMANVNKIQQGLDSTCAAIAAFTTASLSDCKDNLNLYDYGAFMGPFSDDALANEYITELTADCD
jgi:hypothetical protein